jgi:hypothetical protein
VLTDDSPAGPEAIPAPYAGPGAAHPPSASTGAITQAVVRRLRTARRSPATAARAARISPAQISSANPTAVACWVSGGAGIPKLAASRA